MSPHAQVCVSRVCEVTHHTAISAKQMDIPTIAFDCYLIFLW